MFSKRKKLSYWLWCLGVNRSHSIYGILLELYDYRVYKDIYYQTIGQKYKTWHIYIYAQFYSILISMFTLPCLSHTLFRSDIYIYIFYIMYFMQIAQYKLITCTLYKRFYGDSFFKHSFEINYMHNIFCRCNIKLLFNWTDCQFNCSNAIENAT